MGPKVLMSMAVMAMAAGSTLAVVVTVRVPMTVSMLTMSAAAGTAKAIDGVTVMGTGTGALATMGPTGPTATGTAGAGRNEATVMPMMVARLARTTTTAMSGRVALVTVIFMTASASISRAPRLLVTPRTQGTPQGGRSDEAEAERRWCAIGLVSVIPLRLTKGGQLARDALIHAILSHFISHSPRPECAADARSLRHFISRRVLPAWLTTRRPR